MERETGSCGRLSNERESVYTRCECITLCFLSLSCNGMCTLLLKLFAALPDFGVSSATCNTIELCDPQYT